MDVPTGRHVRHGSPRSRPPTLDFSTATEASDDECRRDSGDVSMSRWPSGILDRIRHEPRDASPDEPASSPSSGSRDERLTEEVADLRSRIAHLEQLVQGLQDSVHRGSERQDKRLSDIERQIEPATLAAALSKDARTRGL